MTKKVLFRTLKGGGSIENKKFFTSCERLALSKCTELWRTSFSLPRNGVIAMEELCQMLGHSPEKIAEGPLPLMEVCLLTGERVLTEILNSKKARLSSIPREIPLEVGMHATQDIFPLMERMREQLLVAVDK